MSNAARRDAPPGSYVANHAVGTLGPFSFLCRARLHRIGRPLWPKTEFLLRANENGSKRGVTADDGKAHASGNLRGRSAVSPALRGQTAARRCASTGNPHRAVRTGR